MPKGYFLRRATALACFDSAVFETTLVPSSLRRVRGRLLGGGSLSFTPARRALESPIAIACSVERAPCFPCRIWEISSSMNGPACVDGLLPARFAARDFASVFFVGMGSPPSTLQRKRL